VITDVAQRWRDRRGVYRPAGEVIDPRQFEVAALADDTTPKLFVAQHHYEASYPAARRRFGLYRGGSLVGVAVFSHPVNNATLACLPGAPIENVELGRFVLRNDVAGNGETWFLARCFESLRAEGLVGVVSFSDPLPRRTVDGVAIMPGHVGTIYQAFNGVYLGRARAETRRLLPDGTVLHNRAVAKVRDGERGWRYVVERLERHGAPRYAGSDREAWLERAMRAVVRAVEHPGNLKYAWTLRARDRRHLPPSKPYEKFAVPQLSLPFE